MIDYFVELKDIQNSAILRGRIQKEIKALFNKHKKDFMIFFHLLYFYKVIKWNSKDLKRIKT